jgi:hypothetical protein
VTETVIRVDFTIVKDVSGDRNSESNRSGGQQATGSDAWGLMTESAFDLIANSRDGISDRGLHWRRIFW